MFFLGCYRWFTADNSQIECVFVFFTALFQVALQYMWLSILEKAPHVLSFSVNYTICVIFSSNRVN